MNILITGGAGYIGSIVAQKLLKSGNRVIILDNLEEGHIDAIPKGSKFIRGDIGDTQILKKIFREANIEAVVHLAASALVEESVKNPKKYLKNNVRKGIILLKEMLNAGIKKIIFSSTAAVYGQPQKTPIKESHPTNPINPYGQTKLIYENILSRYQKDFGLKFVIFRYFNATGASSDFGEDHSPETHLIPNILIRASKGKVVFVYGNDYPTKDGSCIRDFVHVEDIADAHIIALNKLDQFSSRIYNLGNSKGHSVFEVINVASKIVRFKIRTIIKPRRAGDPAKLVASSNLVQDELGWSPKYQKLEDIIESTWKWHKNHPKGYSK